MKRREFLAMPAAAFGQTLAPGEPNSTERKALITKFEQKAAGLSDRWERHNHREINGSTMPYRLFLPAGGSGPFPLIVYLHGAGGLGADNEKQITAGTLHGANLWALAETQKRHPCYVVAPQTDRAWIRYQIRRTPGVRELPPVAPGVGEGAAAVADLITTLTRQLSVDKRRVYVTGQSMGGAGTWHMLTHFGDVFAAAVPLCSAPTLDTGAENPHIPVWMFQWSRRPCLRKGQGGRQSVVHGISGRRPQCRPLGVYGAETPGVAVRPAQVVRARPRRFTAQTLFMPSS